MSYVFSLDTSSATKKASFRALGCARRMWPTCWAPSPPRSAAFICRTLGVDNRPTYHSSTHTHLMLPVFLVFYLSLPRMFVIHSQCEALRTATFIGAAAADGLPGASQYLSIMPGELSSYLLCHDPCSHATKFYSIPVEKKSISMSQY